MHKCVCLCVGVCRFMLWCIGVYIGVFRCVFRCFRMCFCVWEVRLWHVKECRIICIYKYESLSCGVSVL